MSYGGAIGNLKDPDNQAAVEAAKKNYLGVAIICGDNQRRFGNLVEELQKTSPRATSIALPIQWRHTTLL